MSELVLWRPQYAEVLLLPGLCDRLDISSWARMTPPQLGQFVIEKYNEHPERIGIVEGLGEQYPMVLYGIRTYMEAYGEVNWARSIIDVHDIDILLERM